MERPPMCNLRGPLSRLDHSRSDSHGRAMLFVHKQRRMTALDLERGKQFFRRLEKKAKLPVKNVIAPSKL